MKQEVINLRQSAVAEEGSERHTEIWIKLRSLEEELSNAKVVPSDTHKKIIQKEFDGHFDNNNIVSRKR